VEEFLNEDGKTSMSNKANKSACDKANKKVSVSQCLSFGVCECHTCVGV